MLKQKRGRFREQQMDSGGDRGAVLGLQLMRRGMRTGLPRARRERGRAGASERMRKRRALHRRLPRGRNSHGLGSDGGRPDDRSMAAFRRAGRETWVRSRSLSVSTVCPAGRERTSRRHRGRVSCCGAHARIAAQKCTGTKIFSHFSPSPGSLVR